MRTSRPALPPRLLAVLPLLAQGLTNQQAARRLQRSSSQVGHDIEALFVRTGVKSRGELVAFAYVHRILDSAVWPPRLNDENSAEDSEWESALDATACTPQRSPA